MAQAPRNLVDILESIHTTHRDVDPSIDTGTGPISVTLYTVAAELTRTEQQSGYLSTVYQLDIADSLDRDTLIKLGGNFGFEIDSGKTAGVIVTMYRIARPEAGLTYTYYAGSQISTVDNRYVFATAADAVMNGDNADVYFNSNAQRYEVNVRAYAIASGTDYNVAPTTITSLITDTTNFDGVVNYYAAFSGRDPLSSLAFRNQLWIAMQGLDRDIVGKLMTLMYSIDPAGFDDVRLVPSSDYGTFERLAYVNGKVGYDIYVISDSYDDTIQSGVAVGGETYILLNNRPVLAVDRIMVDGTTVPFTFLSDAAPEFRGSWLANDRIALATPLLPAQTYEIHYYYYDFVYNASPGLVGNNVMFGADVLIRRANPVAILVTGKLSTTSITNKQDAVDGIRTAVEAYLRNPGTNQSSRTFVTTLDPGDLQNTISSKVAGVATFTITKFNREDNSVMDIEVIELNGKTEYPVLSANFEVI